ncbi:MAG: HNH endonuclease signature motif containing protein [Elusimicrobiales bacterium]|nr:HNH endonuclease signature motif containing protein [Elusimicrobiales bacterium]
MVEHSAVKSMNPPKDKRRYADRREYMIEAVRRRRKKLRAMAIEYKGGKCEACGYQRCPEAMEFHHRVPDGKDFGISQRGYTRSWAKVRKELDKCEMLCANCHREVHAKLQLPPETAVEKSGEFREIRDKRAILSQARDTGSGKVQRLSREGVPAARAAGKRLSP